MYLEYIKVIKLPIKFEICHLLFVRAAERFAIVALCSFTSLFEYLSYIHFLLFK